MVKQGDIIKITFNPQEGYEQAGYKPAVVNIFNKHCSMTLLCPITNTNNKYLLHIPLDERTTTTGVVLCEQLRSMDLTARQYLYVEHMPDDILNRIINTVISEMEVSDTKYSQKCTNAVPIRGGIPFRIRIESTY